MSGYAEEAFANNEPQGQHAFLAKPFELKTLVAKVKETMALVTFPRHAPAS